MKIQKSKGILLATAALIAVGFAIPTSAEAGHPCGRPGYHHRPVHRPVYHCRPSYSYRYSCAPRYYSYTPRYYSYTPRYNSYRSGCGTSSIVSGIVSGLLQYGLNSSHHGNYRHHGRSYGHRGGCR